jgi:asparagine synthetase B (glutamine-hydrolysing)
MREADYLSLLEETTDRLATPPLHYVTPAFLVAYRQPQQMMILGEGADSIFGSGRGMERVSGMLGSSAGLATLSALGRFPGSVGRRAKQIRGYAELFAADPDSAAGYGGRCLLFGDTSIVEAMVGREPIDQVAEGYAALIHEVAEVETPHKRSFHRHIEMHQLRYTISDLAYLDRHLSHSYGKTAVQPFTAWPLLAEALRIPAANRYIKGLQGKWVLKEVLEKRVPNYPIRQRKLATGLPFERYYSDGPLSGIWEKYRMPDFVAPEFRSAVMDTPSAVTFNAITHSIWSERIEKNADLAPLPASVINETVG